MKLKSIQKYTRTREARGTAGTAALMFFSKLANSGIAFILAPMLGAEGYGVYAFTIACISIASIVSLMGLERLVVREIARHQTTEEYETLRGLVQLSTATVLTVSLTMVAAIYIGLLPFGQQLDAIGRDNVLVALVILPVWTLALLGQSILIGLHRVVWGQMPLSLVRPAVFICLCVLIPALPFPRENAALNSFGIATFAGLTAALYMVARALPKRVWTVRPKYQIKIWFSSAMYLMVVTVLQAIQINGTSVLVGLMQDAKTTGIYALVYAFAQFVSFVHVAIDRPLNPAVASLLARNERQELQRTLCRLVRLAFFGALPVAAFLMLFGQLILGIFGEEFKAGYSSLIIMVIGQIVNVATGQPHILLMMSGHEKDLAKATFVRTGLLVSLNIILVPQLGLVGAALAVSLSIILANLLLVHYVQRRLGLHTTILGPKLLSI